MVFGKLTGRAAALAAAAVVSVVATQDVTAQEEGTADGVVVGSGGVTGLYFPVAGAIGRLVTAAEAAGVGPLFVESTGGSMENLIRLRTGDLDFGIVRSDMGYDALLSLAEFDGEPPFGDLRSVMALHSEPLIVIARADSGIRRLTDVAGHRINLGPPGSTTRELLELVLGAQEWERGDADTVLAVGLEDQAAGLCAGDFDVMAYISGQPSGTIHQALTLCDTVLVSVEGAAIDTLLLDHPALASAVVPAGTYGGQDREVRTVGPIATLMTTVDQPEDAVVAVVDIVLADLAALRAQHPALRGLTPGSLAGPGLPAPLHEGARAAFERAGIDFDQSGGDTTDGDDPDPE